MIQGRDGGIGGFLQGSGGRRQSTCLGGRRGGRILAEENAKVFVDQPVSVIGSHNHSCLEAQRRIGKWTQNHTVSMNARAVGCVWYLPQYRSHRGAASSL
jgi:hypothetical protein